MAETIGLAAVMDTSNFTKGLGVYNRGIDQMNRETAKTTGKMNKAFSGLGKGIVSFGKVAATAAVAGVAALGAGIGVLGVASVNTAISFESAFAGVIKTTDGLTSSVGVLNQAGEELRQGFVDLSKEVPIAFEELAAIGELGGQLGIGKDSLIDFTETVAALGVSTNLSTEEAATGLARLSNIFGVETANMGTNIGQLGSTLVALGNNYATTERDILAFGERLAGAGAIAGFTQADILSIGTALSSVGVEAEAGGTATQKVMLAINNAVNGAATGFTDYTKEIDQNVGKLTKLNAESARLEAQFPGLQAEILAQKEAFIAAGGSAEDFGRQLGDKTRQKALEVAESIRDLGAETDLLRQQHGQPIDSKMLSTFAQTAGVTSERFQELWEEDASEAFTMFVEGLGDQGDDAINTLEQLGLSDQRLIRSFLSLAGAGDLLGDAIETGNKAFEDNTALSDEAAQRYATTESQLMILKNTLRAVGDTIGSRFLPFLNQAVEVGKRWIDEWAGPLAVILDTQIIPAIGTFIDFIGQLPAIFQGLQATGIGLFDRLFNAQAIEQMVINLIAQIPSILSTVVSAITEFLSTQGPVIFAAVRSWVDSFWEWTNIVINNAGAALAGIGLAIAAWATGPGQTQLLALGNVLGQNLLDGLIALTQDQAQMLAIMAKIAAGLAIATGAILGIVIIIGSQIVAGIIQGMLEAIGIDLQPALFSELGDILKQIGSDILTIAQVVGTNIIIGIITGIQKGIAQLTTTLNQIGFIIIQTIKDFLGISSPSTVFMQIGADIVSGLIEGIRSMLAQIPAVIGELGTALTDAAGGIFSGLFGGGDGGGGGMMLFDPATMLTGLLEINTFLSVTIPESLVLLGEQFLLFNTVLAEQLNLLTTGPLTLFIMTLSSIYLVHLPTMLAVWMTVSAQIITQTTAMITELTTFITTMQTAQVVAVALATAIVSGMKKSGDSIKSVVQKISGPLVSAIRKATEATNELADAMERVAEAAEKARRGSRAATGIGFNQGVGFQAGTPANTGGPLNLGYKIPSGFPNDTFGPMFAQSGEEMLITPRGMSIESLIFSRLADLLKGSSVQGGSVTNNYYNFDMTIHTGADARAVFGQVDIQRALHGV